MGRHKILTFGKYNGNIAEKATAASNMGIKTVESLMSGICYFFDDEEVVIASTAGFVKMKLDTAETVAKELSEMLEEVREDQREGRHPMDSRSIGKMLLNDM